MENEYSRDKRGSISDIKNYLNSSSHSASANNTSVEVYPSQLKAFKEDSDARFESIPLYPNNDNEHNDSSDEESEQSKKAGRLGKLVKPMMISSTKIAPEVASGEKLRTFKE